MLSQIREIKNTKIPLLEVPASLSFTCIPTYSADELNAGNWLQTDTFIELVPIWATVAFEGDAVACEQEAPDCDLEHDGSEASYISTEEDDTSDCFNGSNTPTLLDGHDDDAAEDDVIVFVTVDAIEVEDIAEDVDIAEWFCIKFELTCDADVEVVFWIIGSIMFPKNCANNVYTNTCTCM